jgi:hypothetical protein
MEASQVAEMSTELTKTLCSALDYPESSWVIELNQTSFFSKGSQIESTPFIEVLWKPRTQDVQDTCAKVITEAVRKIAHSSCFILFQPAGAGSFYKDGVIS